MYVGCTMIGDKHCIKLALLVTLEGTAKIPDEYNSKSFLAIKIKLIVAMAHQISLPELLGM